MAKDKETKTNAMRILDKNKIAYTVNSYECDAFIDGVHVADKLGQSYEQSFKTIVTVGKSKNYYVFVLPVHREIDLKKAAKCAGEKSVEMIPVKELQGITGYIRGGCTSIGMKKNYPVFIHRSALEFDTIIISGGRIGLQLLLAPQDLAKVTNGSFEEIVADKG